MTVSNVGSSQNLDYWRQIQQSAFQGADTNGDGALSLSEFESIGQKVQGGANGAPPPPQGDGGFGARFGAEMLTALLSTQSASDLTNSVMKGGDANNDGQLSASEISSALSSNAPSGVLSGGGADQMAKDIISALDTNGDGSLSASEIQTAITNAQKDVEGAATSGASSTTASAADGTVKAHHGHHHHHHKGGVESADKAAEAKVFSSLDTNGDGSISAAELAAANSSDSSASSTAANLIKAVDKNGDGSLSQSEFDRMLKQGKDAADPTTIAGLMAGGSNSAAGMMQKLLAQLDAAMTTTTASSTTTGASSATGVNTTA